MISLPYALIAFRFLCAPSILILAWLGDTWRVPGILLLMHLGLLSDIFDGIVARHLGEQTEKMRRWDSQTDTIFWLAIAVASWHLHPMALLNEIWAITAILAMQAMCYVVSLLKFGKENCTHAWLSKLWALTLVLAFTRLIGWGEASFCFTLAVVSGLIAHVDVILITLILPRWEHDVPSAYHAWLVRKGVPFRKHKLLNG